MLLPKASATDHKTGHLFPPVTCNNNGLCFMVQPGRRQTSSALHKWPYCVSPSLINHIGRLSQSSIWLIRASEIVPLWWEVYWTSVVMVTTPVSSVKVQWVVDLAMHPNLIPACHHVMTTPRNVTFASVIIMGFNKLNSQKISRAPLQRKAASFTSLANDT